MHPRLVSCRLVSWLTTHHTTYLPTYLPKQPLLSTASPAAGAAASQQPPSLLSRFAMNFGGVEFLRRYLASRVMPHPCMHACIPTHAVYKTPDEDHIALLTKPPYHGRLSLERPLAIHTLTMYPSVRMAVFDPSQAPDKAALSSDEPYPECQPLSPFPRRRRRRRRSPP
ncbi:hypothetical protein LX32DRAFT_642616 [Colletotrichum zoysiae]|uniref:Uncharacterized protein n=1 Tax=Colletotrichum zoysiae TaxID=1216348 RepID=A0AAD9LYE4_9PEZI|nr:hypothetical protein LX32DRAFT_642616 [Colletotrichum zoysiae]